MSYDLIIKNGMVVDGSGDARYRGDIGVKDGKIVKIGRIKGEIADGELRIFLGALQGI